MKKVGIIIFLMSCGLPLILRADTGGVDQKFADANRKFESGHVEEALKTYLNLAQSGYGGTPLYFNIGNAYYRKGERGKALLWYERAKTMAPRDTDIRFNIALASSHLRDFKENFFEKILLYFTPSELAGMVSFFIWVFFILMGSRVLGWIQGDLWPGMALGSSGFLLFLMSAWFGVNLHLNNRHMAIVTSPRGEVRFGPGKTDYQVGFTVPEGSKVIILNKRPEWTEIGVPLQGLKGWIPADEVEEININAALLN